MDSGSDHAFSISNHFTPLESYTTTFEEIMNSVIKAANHFAFSKRYEDAPNPGLSIDGLGGFDLPLSELDARAIISASVPKLSAGSRGVVVPGAWKIASNKVCLQNPAWKRWIQEEAGPAALHALRADCADGQLDYVLRAVEVHEGTQLLGYEVEPPSIAKGQVGILVIMLPSSFSGGKLEFCHDGESVEVELADRSGELTSSVAAYVGVEQTSLALESGYRLGLQYDIVYRGTRLPTLEDLSTPRQKIREFFRDWQEDKSGYAPPFIACLLHHSYSHSAPFNVDTLRDVDELLVSTLRPLAQESKFFIYFAHIQVSVTTTADCSQNDISVAWDEAESFLAEDSFASFASENVEDTEHMTVTQILDLDGNPVEIEGLSMDTGVLINGPEVTLREPDLTTCDTQADPVSVKAYKRTVLLLWSESTSTLKVTVCS
ncbi:2OG-Fe(II) oxygenase [Mycena venus]|uniref:2OG-Fe(II) oxygenase n=1 Tax=Mycena venus TaxID=2733690 RepID=A0A8H7CXA1_9AGAR|nr:2OG-Fe(II) oxygenase [Mycena venus]